MPSDALFDLVEQMRSAAHNNYYYLSLFAALAIPDICGALESPDGRATGARYQAWFDSYVAPKYGSVGLTGEDCYRFRCLALHQGRLEGQATGYARLIFVEPAAAGRSVFHMNKINDALNIDVRAFTDDIAQGVDDWLNVIRASQPYETNAATLMRRHPNGLAPYIVGKPVIG